MELLLILFDLIGALLSLEKHERDREDQVGLWARPEASRQPDYRQDRESHYRADRYYW